MALPLPTVTDPNLQDILDIVSTSWPVNDGLTNDATLRTLGTGAQQAAAGNDAGLVAARVASDIQLVGGGASTLTGTAFADTTTALTLPNAGNYLLLAVFDFQVTTLQAGNDLVGIILADGGQAAQTVWGTDVVTRNTLTAIALYQPVAAGKAVKLQARKTSATPLVAQVNGSGLIAVRIK